MKKFFFLFFFLITIVSFAQKPGDAMLQLTFGTEYVPAKLTFLDNHVEEGYVYGFIENRFFEVNMGFISGFETIENKTNLDDKVFDFRATSNGEVKKLQSKNLKSIVLLGNEDDVDIQYDYINLKTVNSAGEIVDLNKKIWLPLIKKDNISLYGYSYFLTQPNGSGAQYICTPVYLKGANQDFAIPPIDYNRVNLFNLGKIDDKFKIAVKEIFKDCPELIAKMDLEKTFTKEDKRSAVQKYKEEEKEYKAKAKELPRKERKSFRTKFYENKALEPYFIMIDEYNKTCPKQ